MKLEAAILMTSIVLASVLITRAADCTITDCLRARFSCSRLETEDGMTEPEHEYKCCKIYSNCYAECVRNGRKPPICEVPVKRGSWNKREFLDKLERGFGF